MSDHRAGRFRDVPPEGVSMGSAAPSPPSGSPTIQEVERRLRELNAAKYGSADHLMRPEDVARMLVAAARCKECAGRGTFYNPWPEGAAVSGEPTEQSCAFCHGTRIERQRLEAGLKAIEGE